VAGDLTRLTKEIAEARRKVESDARGKSGPKRTNANRALATVEGLQGTLRGWFGFYDGYDPLFTWWMQEPYQAADQALQAYAGFLRQRFGASDAGPGADPGLGPGRRRAGGAGGGGPGPGPGSSRAESPRTTLQRDQEIVGTPIGREALLSELKSEMIAYSPEELIELARKELRWCEDEMKKAAR